MQGSKGLHRTTEADGRVLLHVSSKAWEEKRRRRHSSSSPLRRGSYPGSPAFHLVERGQMPRILKFLCLALPGAGRGPEKQRISASGDPTLRDLVTDGPFIIEVFHG